MQTGQRSGMTHMHSRPRIARTHGAFIWFGATARACFVLEALMLSCRCDLEYGMARSDQHCHLHARAG
jgi:hypothetical protein